MSTNFTGITFAEQKVTPSDDAVIRRAVLPDSILTGCELSYSGSTLTMADGLLMICGRQVRHPAAQNWAVMDATSGYARLLLTIDLTRSASKEAFDQVVDTIEYASSIDGFPDLEQADINKSGTRYQIVACVVSLGPGGISGIVSQLGGSSIMVSLPAASWVNNQQTVAVAGVSSAYSVLVAPDPTDDENYEAYVSAGIRCVGKGNGTLTFKCTDTPDRDLNANVALRV